MQPIIFNRHISGIYNQELENLRNSVLTMGGVIEQQLQDTLDAFRDNQPAKAEAVVLRDKEVNNMETQIDEECMRIIAKRHPIAGDLRMVMTVSKVTNDIERMGDEVERVARMIAGRLFPGSQEIESSILVIGQFVLDMLRGSLNAFARLDIKRAIEVHQLDDQIDLEYKKLIELTINEMRYYGDSMEDWLEVLWSLRALERIGDRCKNICEYVIYLTEGKDMRHQTLAKLSS
jgi:phosphate transport system protein